MTTTTELVALLASGNRLGNNVSWSFRTPRARKPEVKLLVELYRVAYYRNLKSTVPTFNRNFPGIVFPYPNPRQQKS